MPTVPSTFVSNSAYDHVPTHPSIPVDSFLDRECDDAASGPIPDPDVEVFGIAPGDNSDAVTETDSEPPRALALVVPFSGSYTSRQPSPTSSPSRKPRVSLGALSLHSPSFAIVATPFDRSPRFEYPFPSVSIPYPVAPPSAHGDLPHPYGHIAHGAYGHGSVSSWAGLPVSASLPNLSVTAGSPFTLAPGHTWVMAPGAQRVHSQTYHRLRFGEPPVPPSLVRKRLIQREKELGLRSEGTRDSQPGANEVHISRRIFTGPELVDMMQIYTVLQQSLPLSAAAEIPRPKSLERRESDETVVGSSEERDDDDDEKIALYDVPDQPAARLITSTENTQVDLPALVATEDPEVRATIVSDSQLVQEDGGGQADIPVSSHDFLTNLPADRSPLDARPDTFPASPLASIPASPRTVCTSPHDAPAATAVSDDATTEVNIYAP